MNSADQGEVVTRRDVFLEEPFGCDPVDFGIFIERRDAGREQVTKDIRLAAVPHHGAGPHRWVAHFQQRGNAPHMSNDERLLRGT